HFMFYIARPPPTSTLFPYTTLFRSADTARSPAPGLVETVRAALAAEGNGEPLRPSGLQQLVSLGLPFDPYEQAPFVSRGIPAVRSEEHTSELQSRSDLVCRLLLEKK